MVKQVTLPLRPGQSVVFPNVCVACGRPATEHITINKKQGQTEYSLDVPLCADCARLSQRRSGREETLLRMGWPAAGAGALLGFALVWLLTAGMDFRSRLAAGLIAGVAAAGLAYWSFRRVAQAAELPEKRTIREAAQISGFSWRDVTLMLADAALAERVLEMNTLPPADPAEEPLQADEQTL